MQDKTSKASIDRFASLGNSARRSLRPTSIVSLRDDLTTVVIFGTPPEAHSLNHHLREPAQYKCCQVEVQLYSFFSRHVNVRQKVRSIK